MKPPWVSVNPAEQFTELHLLIPTVEFCFFVQTNVLQTASGSALVHVQLSWQY